MKYQAKASYTHEETGRHQNMDCGYRRKLYSAFIITVTIISNVTI